MMSLRSPDETPWFQVSKEAQVIARQRNEALGTLGKIGGTFGEKGENSENQEVRLIYI